MLGTAGELRALMEAAVDAIVVIDEAGKIVAFSPAAEKMFGHSADEIIGRPVHELMPEPYRSEHASYIGHYLATREARIIGAGREVEACRSDGEVFPVWLSVGEALSGSRRRFVGILRDLSEQRAAEGERHALEARLAHVGRFSLMGEMAAGIAHELNQPLSAIANYSQAARYMLDAENLDTEALRTACNGISEQVQRAGKVIGNLRGFIRKREITKSSLDLNETIRGAMNLVLVDAANGGVAVTTEFAPDLPRVEGNMVQLQQVLLNLTRNAVDATQLGPKRRERRMRIATAPGDDGAVEFGVDDNGPGVSPDLADAIFHPFVTTKVDGLGVGLAISRTIVEAHGGKLWYRDNPDGGAAFTVSLPSEEDEDS